MKKTLLLTLSILFAIFTAGAEDAYRVKVSSPNGAPGIALALLAEKNPQDYTYVAAETIAAEFANKKADFIIAPIS